MMAAWREAVRPLTFVSLFAGIGGLDLGLERAGMRCVGQVEIDDYATRVLAKHWPDVPRWRDVRDVGSHNLPACDLICGGFPCQDISFAGRGAGITEGTRSGLWIEYARIISELRPRYVLVENVAALLARGLTRVLADLAVLRFDAEWEVIPACAFGAPHTRERLFLVAYANGCDGSPGMGAIPYGPFTYGHQGYTQCASVCASAWLAPSPDLRRVAHGLARDVDRRERLGNAVVPQVAEYVGRLIVAHATKVPA